MPHCPTHGPKEGRYCPECGTELLASLPATGDRIAIRSPEAHASVQVVMPNGALPGAPPALLRCPKCGHRNSEADVFDCRGPCGRENLCHRHFDETFDLCKDCATLQRGDAELETARKAEIAAQARALGEALARSEAEVKAKSEALAQTRAILQQAEARLKAQAETLTRVEAALAEWRPRAERAEVALARAEAEVEVKVQALRRAEAGWSEWRNRGEKAEGQLAKIARNETSTNPGGSLPINYILSHRYQIEAAIDRGTLGSVFRARDLAQDLVVAIKEVSGEKHFVSERIQLELNHPNIVRAYELLELGNDQRYLVMEYVDGENLRDYLVRHGPLPADEAVRIMSGLLAGLAAVHEHRAVHLDINPSNAMLTKADQVKLSDFGSAIPLDRTWIWDYSGTPLYMSPEWEKRGYPHAFPTPASDVFSAGCVFFELLTGVVYKQAKGRQQELLKLMPNTPVKLDDLITKMLAVQPNARPQDGGEARKLLAEIKRFS